MHNDTTNNTKAKDFVGSIKRLFKELKSYRLLITISLLLAFSGSILSIISPNKLSQLVDEISNGLIINTTNMEKINTSISNNLNSLIDNNDDININNKEEIINKITSLDETQLNIIFKDIIIDDITINSIDQLEYLKILSELDTDADTNILYSKIDDMPDSIKKLISPKMNMNKIKKITIFLLCLYIFSSLFNYIEAISMTIVSNNFAKKLRSDISQKINRLPLKYFDKNKTGDVLSRVTNDIDTIAQTMNQSLADFVSSLSLFIGTIIMMFITNYIMALTAILSSVFGFLFMSLVLSKSQKYHNQRQEYLGEINGHIEEVYSGFKIVRAYNAKEEVSKKFDEINEKLYTANRKGQFLSSLMMPMMSFVGNFGYVAVCIVGSLLVMNDKITFGVIIAFITYVRLFTSPLSQISQAMNSFQMTAASSERVFEIKDEEEMSKEDNIVKKLTKDKVKGNIVFDNVTFTYSSNIKPTIKNFSAKVKSGNKIAIVGPTGAGKTTMVNLLMKFYDIDSGDIKIDDISIKELSRENIHSLFTMVLQDTWLFEGTIKENIIYNRKKVPDKRVEEVCKTIGLDHYIKTLPQGYNSKISDSDNISAGQKQLITIARGMIEDAPFLILDEATSNVDTRTEELVSSAMDKLMKNKTSFIIAHRLSTIKNADLILVMNNGSIIEVGNHDELIKKNGFYASLYNSQFKL